MMHKNRWTAITLLCSISFFGSNGTYAESFSIAPKSQAPQSDSVDRVIQAMSYIDTRLLSSANIKRIEASNNYVAIAVLHRSLSDRELVGAQVNQGRFEEAYATMRAIEKRIAATIKLSWANKQRLNKLKT